MVVLIIVGSRLLTCRGIDQDLDSFDVSGMDLSMYHRSIYVGLASIINETGDFRPIDYLDSTAFIAEQSLVKALVPLIAGDLHSLPAVFITVQDCQRFLTDGCAQRLFGFVCE